ncbi:MAG TPA: hypothetical protein VIZ22_05940 [Candidatus Limnocylindrales bacterium]
MPTATPIATPSTTPQPSPAAGPTAWPRTIRSERGLEPVFAPDGTAYYLAGGLNARLVALDRAGNVKPGWPIEEPKGAQFGRPAVGPDGDVHVEECAGAEVGCVVHRLDEAGRDVPGWPIDLPSDFACIVGSGCAPGDLTFGLDGDLYVSHPRKSRGLRVLALDASGRIKPGWPVEPPRDGLHWGDLQIGGDGTLYLLGVPDGGGTRSRIAAFGRDGSRRPGWPVPVPGVREYLVGPEGTVVTWRFVDDVGELCMDPRRTVYTVLGAEGHRLPGWPRGSEGSASRPAIGADGTLYYVSRTYRAYAHDLTGEIKAGWPVPAPGASGACGPETPSLAPDGTVFIVGDAVWARSPDGGRRPGWPYRPRGSLVGPCFDSECYGGHQAPAFGADGTAYLVAYRSAPGGVRAEIVALDSEGQVKPGWPYRLPFDANEVSVGPISVSPDGRVIVQGGGWSPYILLALDPDGTLAD